jgi:hypothetical protein
VDQLVKTLREKFGDLAVFFHNDLSPDVIGMVWRPQAFRGQAFSALFSEYTRPIDRVCWKSDSLAVTNMEDILNEIQHLSQDVVADIKVMEHGSFVGHAHGNGKGKPYSKKQKTAKDDSEEEDSN